MLDWSHAEFIVGVTDARGALSDGTITIGGKTLTTLAGGDSGELLPRLQMPRSNSSSSSLARRPGNVQPNTHFTVTATLRFSGAQRIALLAYGKTTHLTVQGDWPDPSFDGGFLPVSHTISPHRIHR